MRGKDEVLFGVFLVLILVTLLATIGSLAYGYLSNRTTYVCKVDEVLDEFETTFRELAGETIYTRDGREFIFPGRGAECVRKKEEVL